MKRNIWHVAIPLLFLLGCSAHQQTVNAKREFHTPLNWQTPIAKSTERSQKESFKPNFRREQTQTENQKTAEFTPNFDSSQKRVVGASNNNAAEWKIGSQAAPSKNLEQMVGHASWYGPGFHGKHTANGEQYNQNKLTAAHKILPMNTWVRVKNMENNRTVVVRINDRGPYKKNRIIDLTRRAATELGFVEQGTARVELEVLKYPKNYNPAEGLEPYKQVAVQVAVFSGKERAESFMDQLADKYRQINFQIDDHKENVYHVIAGPFNERTEAVRVAGTLRSDGIDNFVRSYRK